MCGISAVIETQSSDASTATALMRMHESLAHRGPDGEGYLLLDAQIHTTCHHNQALSDTAIPHDTRLAAAFRWLKIQDLDSASNQPMSSPDHQYWILFNGEIYNYRALRQELTQAGFQFRTESDTEVVIAAYQHWGATCFSRFNGMWAILLLDLQQRKVVLSRDRLGIKPLFYSWDGPRLLVASEAKAVALARRAGPAAEHFRLHEFLRGLPPQSAELSFFRDVHPVPPGTWAELPLHHGSQKELQFTQFWNLADIRIEERPETDFEHTREEFENLLITIVRDHAHASVDVGTLLSGGIDSSMLARLLAEYAFGAGNSPPKAYSIVYQDPQMSEWPYMQMVLAKGGLKGVNYLLTPDAAWNSVADVVATQGRPLLGQDAIAQYHAYQLARQHGSKVVLDGQGADELLAGLPLYEAQMFPEWLRRKQSGRLRSELRIRMLRYNLSVHEAVEQYVRIPLKRAQEEALGLPRYDWLDNDTTESSHFGLGRTNDWGPEKSALTRFLYRHVRHTNLPAVLTNQDLSSMRHGIESRVPFVDHRLVEFAFRLPENFKVNQGIRKRILIETSRKYLPHLVANRRDKRMFISKRTWMELRQKRSVALLAMAASDELRNCALLKPDKIQSFVTGYLKGQHHDEMAIWRLYSLSHWLRLLRPITL